MSLIKSENVYVDKIQGNVPFLENECKVDRIKYTLIVLRFLLDLEFNILPTQMNKKTKRIVAREFLYVLGTVILWIVMMFVDNYFENKNSEKIQVVEGKLESITTYDALPFRLRVYHFLNKEKDTYTFVRELGSRENFLEQVKNVYKAEKVFNFLKGWGGIPVDEYKFYQNIKKDIEDQASETYLEEKIIPLEQQKYNLEQSFFNSNTEDRQFGILWILIFMLFGLRYLIYATTWSVIQLRTS